MADETLRFDIVGEDHLSEPLARAGDSAGTLSRHMDAAARSAAVLDEALKRQQTAARVSVDATLALARADKILEDAEHGLRDGALEAEFALKKQAEAARQSGRAADEAAVKNKALAESLKKMQSGGPGVLPGAALLLTPAIGTLAGVTAGAGIGLAGAFTAGAGALAAFGAVAKPVLSDALTAEQAVNTAQNNYTIAIANGTKQSVAYKAEQVAIGKAYAELSPAQVALSKQLGTMADAWDNLKAAQTPVVAGALQPWLRSVTDLTSKLGPIIAKVSPVIAGLGVQFGALINSAAFTALRNFLAGTGSAAVGAFGGTFIDFLKAGAILLVQFNPLIQKTIGWIAGLGPALLTWASSKKTADDITKFMAWFTTNGPAVGTLLKNLGAALKNLTPGLTAGGILEIKAVSDFLGFIAKLPQGIAGPLAAIAGGLLLLNKLGALSIVVKGVQDLTKAMTGFDIAANANVIGLIVIAVAALGVAFYEAWKKSAGFRDVMKAIASGFLQYGIVIVQIYKMIVTGFLAMVQTILDGAAKAFGWIPGLGGKLRGAAAAFSTWRTGVNSDFDKVIAKMQSWQTALDASKNKSASDTQAIGGSFYGLGVVANTAAGKVLVFNQSLTRLPKNVAVTLTETGVGNFTITQGTSGHAGGTPTGGRPGAAAGMYVATGTGPTADDVLIRASRGELVVPAHLVAGGMVDHLKGLIPGFASGGSIGGLAPATTSFNNQFIAAMTTAMEKAMTTAMKAAVAAATAAAATVSSAAGAFAGQGGSNAANIALAKKMAAAAGWTGAEWTALLAIIMQESGGSSTIKNPGSSASGIAQNIAGFGPGYQYGNAAQQIAWMISYIKGRYGDPIRAEAFHLANNYYDRGGWLMPGVTMAVNNTGRPERVTPGGADDPLVAELRALRAEVRHLTATAADIPRATGQHVAAGVGGAAAAASFRVRYP